jgi:hypothetical protein
VAEKKFALRADQIKPLVQNRGGCIATDMITVEGARVGYMYRDEPLNDQDSGWVFTAGAESQAYMDDATKHGVYAVNTIANYDPAIIPFLDAPPGVAFAREDPSGGFVQVDGEPWVRGAGDRAPGGSWPPPGYPVVEGDHALTEDWSMHLPERFARRVEEGSLVLWRPGLTVWLTAWNNDLGETQEKRLARIKETASPTRYAEHEEMTEQLIRYSYRLHDENEDGPVESVAGFVIGENGQLQMAVYFENSQDETTARELFKSVVQRR